MRKLGFGIVGTGWVSSYHINAVNENKDLKLVGIYSRTSERAYKLAKKYGIIFYKDYHEMLSDSQIDVIDIVNPSFLHADFGIQALHSNKHVLVEKPIDTNRDKAKMLLKTARERKKYVACVSQFRFSEGIQVLRKAIQDKSLGKIESIDVQMNQYRDDAYYLDNPWRMSKDKSGGGILIMNVIHIIDIIIWLFGPIHSIEGIIQSKRSYLEIEDTACLSFVAGQKIKCKLFATNNSVKPEPIKMRIRGSSGSLNLENFGMHSSNMELQNLFRLQIKDIADSIIENRCPITEAADGLKALDTINKIYDFSERK